MKLLITILLLALAGILAWYLLRPETLPKAPEGDTLTPLEDPDTHPSLEWCLENPGKCKG